MSDIVYTYMKSPVGELLLAREEAGLTKILFRDGPHAITPEDDWLLDAGPLTTAMEQLEAYFEGELHGFDLRLVPKGTPFQRSVWEALRTIPLGTTVRYQDIANLIGRPTACRAVGAANGRNPISIVIPCHRVIGSDGRLTGYAGGIPIKEALLAHERSHFGVYRGQLSLI